ncbi:MAG: hypothetical protein JWO03_1757 [Bacteroidetes bacterium]|nr:hypothetical protein [Bacteroidota bacterium]
MHTSTILKRTFALITGCLLFAQISSAQFVTIPDSNFVSWLHNSSYASCMNGNQMDTTCTALVTDTFFDIHFSWIHDITGVQYLKNVTYMDCDEAQLTYIQAFPPALREFHCFVNHLTGLPPFPATVTALYCSHNQLTSLPALPAGLTYLDVSSNYHMTALPALPASLTHLDCKYDQIPGAMPALPASLVYLDCSLNRFTSLPALPFSLQFLFCYYDSLSSLPTLPTSLLDLECEYNQLTALPSIPASLNTLACDYNKLTVLPFMPNSVTYLSCGYNDIATIPNLPDSMDLFYCRHNLHLTCLPQLGKIGSLNFDSTAITCLGNYPVPDSNTISNSSPPLSSVSLCTAGNANGCAVFTGVRDIKTISSLAIYPNPVNDVLTISGATGAPIQIAIYSVQGQCVRTITTESQTTEIKTSGLAPGMYVLRLSAHGGVVNRSFVKE